MDWRSDIWFGGVSRTRRIVTTGGEPLDVNDVLVLIEDLDKHLALILTFHRLKTWKNKNFIHIEAYIEVSLIKNIFLWSLLRQLAWEAYIGFSFRPQNKHIRIRLLLKSLIRPSKTKLNVRSYPLMQIHNFHIVLTTISSKGEKRISLDYINTLRY